MALPCVASGPLFHWNLGDRGRMIHLMKNFALAGGLLLLARTNAACLSIGRLQSGGTKSG